MIATQAGYYQDADTTLYVTEHGTAFLVQGPDDEEPVWTHVGDPLGDDAKPATLDAEDYARYERSRVDQGVVK